MAVDGGSAFRSDFVGVTRLSSVSNERTHPWDVTGSDEGGNADGCEQQQGDELRKDKRGFRSRGRDSI